MTAIPQHNKRILTWFDGGWHEGNTPILGSADHGTWLGTMVFDGARAFEGVVPDLDRHCARINESARAMALVPTESPERIEALVREGLARFPSDAAVYIRPMYWSLYNDFAFVVPTYDTAFCLCLEEAPMVPADTVARATRTPYRRPHPDSAPLNAKASCLYPNVQRMLRDARARGFTTALVCDQLGNLAEAATANVFLVHGGVVTTPMPNGTFLNGLTRQRIIALLRADGVTVEERTLSYDDVDDADEVFITANYSKLVPVVAFDDVVYPVGPVAQRARSLYWSWAHSGTA